MINVFFKGFGNWYRCDDPDLGIWGVLEITKVSCAIGVFSLSLEDSITYRHTNSLAGITALYPCEHPDSQFMRVFGEKNCFALGAIEQGYYFSINNPSNATNILVIAEPSIKSDIEPICNNAYQSDQLKILCQASEKFWGNADPAERDTHQKNEIVSNWLIDQGFSKVNAKQGATIIRPVWAAKGNY
ncbi:hypothetical protein [Methylobacter psychrophilus]|uniref:hypothetical protein n=1 Tax=Methylobacter psychrophilus TaxID=96941 RepID=UPI0021D4C53A|nr:hypothetical protein [Methylobacter psychrophilus]